MAHHHIRLIDVSTRRSAFLFFLFALVWETSFGWRWKTEDAIIQDVWPEQSGSSVKLKRASTRSIGVPRNKLFPNNNDKTSELSTSKLSEDSEDELVFEGQYFEPNQAGLPPPPSFMVINSNWRGSTGTVNEVTQNKLKTLYKQQRPSSYFVVGVGEAPPPTEKFTSENVKIPEDANIPSRAQETMSPFDKVVNNRTEGSSSNDSPQTVVLPRNHKQPLELPSFEEIHYYEEKDLELLEMFKEAPKCFTSTDNEGRCILFKKCYPVVFRQSDGELRNPGLAKLLYQASGPCNATLEFEFALRKLNDDKAYLKADFYNQTVCCPGFKYPPKSEASLKPWQNELRSARLILTSDDTERITSASSDSIDTTTAAAVNLTSSISPIATTTTLRSSKENLYESDLGSSSKSPPVADDESSVELETFEVDTETSTAKSPGLIVFDDFDEEEDTNGGGEEFGEIIMESPSLSESAKKVSEEDLLGKESRRGDREKVKDDDEIEDGYYKKAVVGDAFSSVPAPNLAPMTCRQQIYGMPRGHWPWMVALVIRSRHICSGALLDDKNIITGAHCVYLLSESDVRKLRIIIGDRVMYSSVDGPHFWRKVTKVITHANYNQQTFASDIAILKLNSAVPFSRNIQPISLPDSSTVDSSLIYGKGIVAGWSGADIGQPAFEARTEIETVVDIMEKSECHDIYRGFALSGLSSNTFCTKPANNTCVADSGAPLIVRSQNCWVLQGIMSWGIGCSHFPEVYTDVAKFVPWIRKHLG